MLLKREANPVLVECGIHTVTERIPYYDLIRDLEFMKVNNREAWGYAVRDLGEMDFFFFCYYVLGLPVNDPFIMARCYEVQDHDEENNLWVWARDHWKALAYDTPVLTNRGWARHGELRVGDYVFGSNGKFVKVIARTENFKNSRQYEITFDNKHKIVASCDHVWNVEKKSRKRISGSNRRVGRESCLMTTDEIFSHGCDIDNRLAVKLCTIEYPDRKFVIDPYTLGAWLGDGSSSDGRIHGLDAEIFDKIKESGYEVRDSSREVTKTIVGIKKDLKKIGVLCNKHIPEEYKTSGVEQRMELIRGLMDTDGSIDNRNTCTFTNINKRLCDDLYELLISVGYKANYRTHIGKFCDKDYVFYNISFSARVERNPFFLKRKAERVYVANKDIRRFITDIKPLRDGEHLTNCIQVDAEDGIYLAGKELIPTHNSTIITYAMTIWKLVRIKGYRIALFSNSMKLIKPRFLQIKRVLEKNQILKEVWDDRLYANPEKDAEIWSAETGLYLKGNNEAWASLSCFGLIDAMPTGGHYHERIIDDLVDLKNIGTDFMMQKVLSAYELADNLGSGENSLEQVIGTRYRFGDLYEHIIGLKQHRTSIIAGEVDEEGKPKYGGIPVLLSKEVLDQKKIRQKKTYWAQIILSPLQEGSAAFKVEDLRFYEDEPEDGNLYIVGDPAVNPEFTIVKKPDFTCMWLIKACKGRRLYVIDIIRDQIGVKDKWNYLKSWHKRYKIEGTGWEEFGTQKDREYFKEKMEEERFYFEITPLKNNNKSKPERIAALEEDFADHKIYLPKHLTHLTKDRGVVDLVTEFINIEYSRYPLSEYDDMLDALAKIKDMDVIYPEGDADKEVDRYMDIPSPLDDDFNDIQCMWGDL